MQETRNNPTLYTAASQQKPPMGQLLEGFYNEVTAVGFDLVTEESD